MKMIRERRSIRRFLDREVESGKINILIEAALRSPSSRSLNPWEFIIVTDSQMLDQLSQCKPHGASFLKGAPLGIIVIADPEKCDVWVEDTSIASTYIQLAAEAEGLKSCWIQIRKRSFSEDKSAADRVAELVGIPAGFEVESIIAVGYPDETKAGHPDSYLQNEKIHYGMYGSEKSE